LNSTVTIERTLNDMGTPKRLAVVPSPSNPRHSRIGRDYPHPHDNSDARQQWIQAATGEALRIFRLLPNTGHGCYELEQMLHGIHRGGRWPREAEWLPP